jgi:hypothetical protein
MLADNADRDLLQRHIQPDKQLNPAVLPVSGSFGSNRRNSFLNIANARDNLYLDDALLI